MAARDAMQLLIVEDDVSFRQICASWFVRQGHEVREAETGQQALEELNRHHCDVVILDMHLPGLTGLELLERLREADWETEVVVLTGERSVETAVQAMKLGAADYLTKPFPLPELQQRCRLAFERGRLQKENRHLRTLLQRQHKPPQIIGQSSSLQEVLRLLKRMAPTEKPVLIQGESGTGKELVAQALHRGSSRREAPFVTINCAALPEHLVESELFGHEKGAFTGATAESPGLFEVADGGTLFIDEIGELPLSLQPKLLRVLEDGSLRRVGSVRQRRVNVRVLAATNRNLPEEVAAGRFRDDLFYRIDVLRIDLPPLRERQGDIPLLVDHFLDPAVTLEPEAREALLRYNWPGNIRQLKNVLERAVVLAEDSRITLEDLPSEIADAAEQEGPRPPALFEGAGDRIDLASVERAHILQVLQREEGNKSRAARVLGIHRRKLYRLLQRYGIRPE